MQNQTRLTDKWLKPVVPSRLSSPTPSRVVLPSTLSSSAVSGGALIVSSHAQSIASSRAQLVASSCMQSAASSAGPSPSPLPSEAANDSPQSSWDLLHGPSPSVLRKQTPIELEVSNSEDEDQLGHDVANTGG